MGGKNWGNSMIEQVRALCFENNAKPKLALVEYILGKVYLQIANRAERIHLSLMVKNIKFLIKNVPFAAKRSEEHLKRAIG